MATVRKLEFIESEMEYALWEKQHHLGTHARVIDSTQGRHQTLNRDTYVFYILPTKYRVIQLERTKLGICTGVTNLMDR